MADIRYDFVRTYITLLNNINIKDFNDTMNGMKADGSRLLFSAGYRVTAVAIDGKPAVFDRNRSEPVVA